MRVFKNHLRKKLRLAQEEDGESGVIEETCLALNAFFYVKDKDLWRERNSFVMPDLIRWFNFSERNAEYAINFMRNTHFINAKRYEQAQVVMKKHLLVRLMEKMGLRVASDLLQKMDEAECFNNDPIFEENDISYVENVNHLDIVHRVRALSMFIQGTRLNVLEDKKALDVFSKAQDIVEKMLESSSMDPWLLMLNADICALVWGILSYSRCVFCWCVFFLIDLFSRCKSRIQSMDEDLSVDSEGSVSVCTSFHFLR